jgi:2-polyprenyl-3-methyl-5-hydroxy-6-metoxy-1,4-benzoquinol methylase
MTRNIDRFSWTPEAVARYWDYVSSRDDLADQYFAKQVGAGVAGYLGSEVELAGAVVLDYGCGPGHLVDHLIARGARVYGADLSAASVFAAHARLADNASWGGGAVIRRGELPFDDSVFDVVLSVETIEHVLDDELSDLFREIRRVVRPSGAAVFTTPNDEDLKTGMNFCPGCGAEFHRWQHVRSWNRETLSVALNEAGFSVMICSALDFRDFLSDGEASRTEVRPGNLISRALQRIRRVRHHIDRGRRSDRGSRARTAEGGSSPHLVAVARKR